MSNSHRLAAQLEAARLHAFVGRTAELDLFKSVLEGNGNVSAIYLYGPAGTGKSTLLAEFARMARGCAGAMVISLDSRELEPTPQSLMAACGQAAAANDVDGWTVLDNTPRPIVLIDTYEDLAPLDSWIRDQFLPRVAVLVLAGRNAPAPAWRSDPGLSALCRMIALRNFLPLESRAYLTRRRVAPAHHDILVGMTHGHPLALALFVDLLSQEGADVPVSLDGCPDVVQMLTERFVTSVASAQHRAALEVSALARVTTEAVLAEMLDVDDAHALFAWLRGLSFMEQAATGVFPHDLARDVLDADLRWRNPERYRELRKRLRIAIARRLASTIGAERQRAAYDKLFLHKRSSFMRPYFDFHALNVVHIEPARDVDHAAILDILHRHEGPASKRIAARWLECQPEAFQVWRSEDGAFKGVMAHLRFATCRSDDLHVDPAMRSIFAHVEAGGGLRPGECFLVHRYWAGIEAYQDTTSQTVIAAAASLLWMTLPSLAWSFPCTADPEHWGPMFAYCGFTRERSLDFSVGGHTYGVFAHDWRREPALAWLDMLAERESELNVDSPQSPRAPRVLVLSRPDFAEAVRQALRDYRRPAALAGNQLLQSRVLLEKGDQQPGVDRLRRLLETAVEALRGSPRDDKLYRAVWHTYFEPADSQELAAERLGVPFSTFRYRLKGGVERVIEWLWQQDIQGGSPLRFV